MKVQSPSPIILTHLENKGFVRQRVFFNLLDCLDFKIGESAKE